MHPTVDSGLTITTIVEDAYVTIYRVFEKATRIVVVLLLVATVFKKSNALSFQIGSR